MSAWVDIEKRMHGLPQAGFFNRQITNKKIANHWYSKLPHTSGLWKHTTRPLQFTLIVIDDSFLINT